MGSHHSITIKPKDLGSWDIPCYIAAFVGPLILFEKTKSLPFSGVVGGLWMVLILVDFSIKARDRPKLTEQKPTE